MTSKTSLFNLGIFRATIKRNLWGSVLFAIFIFMSTSLIMFFALDKESTWYMMSQTRRPLILTDQYLALPVIMSLVVPTVVALLVFRFVHSKKASVFVHSLPVSRTANYISTIAGALVLMLVPIVLNGAVLLILSFTVYKEFFTPLSCFLWMGINGATIVMMFSVAVFSAMMTGNSFALTLVNVICHFLVMAASASVLGLMTNFLYGFTDNTASNFIQKTQDWNMIFAVINETEHLGRYGTFENSNIWILLGSSIVFYVLGWFLYKKRKLETAEDVAAFSWMNPVFKYLLTTVAALLTFAVLSQVIYEHPMLPIFVTVIVTAIIYFAVEMILKKSMKIWNTWKGYAVFGVVFSCFLMYVIFSSCLGYETRVPDVSEIEKVAVFEGYYSGDKIPWMDDSAVTACAVNNHKKLTQKSRIMKYPDQDVDYYNGINIMYRLKNGKELFRYYSLTPEELYEINEELFKSKEYKQKNENVFSLTEQNVQRIYVSNEAFAIREVKQMKELLENMKKDILALDYSEIVFDAWDAYIEISYIEDFGAHDEAVIRHESVRVNSNFENTIKWFCDNGYGEKLFNPWGQSYCVVTNEEWQNLMEMVDKRNQSGKEEHRPANISDIPEKRIISDTAEKEELREVVFNIRGRSYAGKESLCYLCTVDNVGTLNIVASFNEGFDEIMKFAK